MMAALTLLCGSSALLVGPAVHAPARASVRMAAHEGEQILLSKFGLPAGAFRTDRRQALGLGLAAVAAVGTAAPALAEDPMFTLPPLPYAYDALEPNIDAATMKFHHDFHHQAYITNLNKAMAGKPAASLVSLMPDAKKNKINNAGGGHYNHCLLWSSMGPKAGGAPTGDLAKKMDEAFGSYDGFKTQFSAAAAGVFGSGWAWLVVSKDGSVKISSSPNQDNPLMDAGGDIPILGIDVWEHAYYLKYQNRRPEYIAAFYNVINWDKVGEYYATAATGKPIEF